MRWYVFLIPALLGVDGYDQNSISDGMQSLTDRNAGPPVSRLPGATLKIMSLTSHRLMSPSTRRVHLDCIVRVKCMVCRQVLVTFLSLRQCLLQLVIGDIFTCKFFFLSVLLSPQRPSSEEMPLSSQPLCLDTNRGVAMHN